MADQPLDGVQSYLDNINTERQRAWNEANEITERLNAEGRVEMTADERTKWDRVAGPGGVLDQLKEQSDSLANRIRTEREHDELRATWEPVVRPADNGSARDAVDPFEAWVRGNDMAARMQKSFEFSQRDMEMAARERALLREGLRGAELRTALNATTNAAGKYTVPTDFLRRLFDYMEAASGIRRTNVTVISTSGGEPLQVPTVTSHGTAAIVGESTALAAADPAFGQITLGAYKYGQLAQITNELLTDTGVDVLGFLARDFGRALGRVTGTAYWSGSGSNAPQGIAPKVGTGATIQTVATGVPSYANLVDLTYSVIEEYRMNGAQWVMRDQFEGTIRKIVDSQGRPLWQPVVQAGEPDLLLGYPVIDDRNPNTVGTAAGTCALFGDFSAFAIREAGPIRIERSDEFAFSSDVVTYRAIMRTDSNMIDVTGGAVKLLLQPTT